MFNKNNLDILKFVKEKALMKGLPGVVGPVGKVGRMKQRPHYSLARTIVCGSSYLMRHCGVPISLFFSGNFGHVRCEKNGFRNSFAEKEESAPKCRLNTNIKKERCVVKTGEENCLEKSVIKNKEKKLPNMNKRRYWREQWIAKSKEFPERNNVVGPCRKDYNKNKKNK